MKVIHLKAMTLLIALAAAPAAAETYKWVDAKGVVNYSSTPPPGVVAKTQVVTERVSVVPPDPSMGPAVAAMEARVARRAEYDEADFARRQQAMLQMQASNASNPCYGGDCDLGYASSYYPYGGYAGWGYLTGGGSRRIGGPRVTHHRAAYRASNRGGMRTGGVVRAGRGSFR